MATKQTLRERVKTFLASNPNGETPATIHKSAAPKYPMQSVHTVLWQMRKRGEVRHDAEMGKYYPMTSRAETKPAETKPAEVPPKETTAYTEKATAYTVEELCDVIDGMDAIIRYLENRVETLIREQGV
jgi:hypothetical protein